MKRVKKLFILMARRSSSVVLQQPSGYPGYLQPLNSLYTKKYK